MKRKLAILVMSLVLILGVFPPNIVKAEGYTITMIYMNNRFEEIAPRTSYIMKKGDVKTFNAPEIEGYWIKNANDRVHVEEYGNKSCGTDITFFYYPDFREEKEVIYPEFNLNTQVTIETSTKEPDIELEKVEFTDLKGNEWFMKDLNKVAGMGIIKGITNIDGEIEFRPNDTLTNAQFYTMIAKLFGTTDGGQKRYFEDLKMLNDVERGDEWYSPYVNALEQAQIISGSEKENKHLLKGITRLEAVALLTKLSKRHGVPTVIIQNKFKDTAGITEEVIDIVQGYPNGNYGLNDVLTRSQSVALIGRTLELLGL